MRYPYSRTVKRLCGHVTGQIFNCHNGREADAYADCLRKTFCDDCRKRVNGGACDRGAAEADELPPLIGSAGRVAWARDIRRKVYSAVKGLSPELVEVITTATSAKWWIDHRDFTVEQIVAELKCTRAVRRAA